jgi:hypothetical protein
MLGRREKYLLPRLLTIPRLISLFFWIVLQQRMLAVGYRPSGKVCGSNLQGSSRTLKTTQTLTTNRPRVVSPKIEDYNYIATERRKHDSTVVSPWSSHYAVPIGGQNKTSNLLFLISYHLTSNTQKISFNITRRQEQYITCQYYSSLPN